MGKIHKQMKTFLLFAMVLTLLLPSGLIALAAGKGAALKTLQAAETEGAGKKVTKYTLYTNGTEAALDKAALDKSFSEYAGWTMAASRKSVTLRVDAVKKKASDQGEIGWTVSSNNQKVAAVVKNADSSITVTAKGNGKATITLKDKYSKKKSAVKITVKTLADEITLGSNADPAVNAGADYTMDMAVKGSLSLNALAVNGSEKNVSAVSSAKLKYKIISGKGIVTVSNKGVVKGKKEGDALIRVSAQDQVCTSGKKKAAVGRFATVLVHVKGAGDTQSLGFVSSGSSNETVKKKSITVNLKTNAVSPDHTYDITLYGKNKAGEDLTAKDCLFVSSKPAVASVDTNGRITACKNGTAKITASPADGTNAKGTVVKITVKVTTDPDVINVPNNSLTVQVGKQAKLGATVAKGVSKAGKKLEYAVENVEPAGCITVNKKGVVKAAAAGTATVRIFSTSKEWSGITRLVKVTAVSKITRMDVRCEKDFTSVKGEKANKVTLYTGAQDGKYSEAVLKPFFNNNQNTSEDELKGRISYTSSKPSVASVDKDGKITAKAKGTAKITVKTTDGSNKKKVVAVSVVQLVTDIRVSNAREDKDGLRLDILKGTQSAAVSAATNADAYKKNMKALDFVWDPAAGSSVTWNNKSKKLMNIGTYEADEQPVGVLTVRANTGLLNGQADERFEKAVKVNVYVVADPAYAAAKEPITLTLKKGETRALQEELADKAKQKEIKWTSSSKKIVTVKNNGAATGKKIGEATVRANGTDIFKIRVTLSQADFEKDLDARVKSLVSAEDYTVWTGMKPKFNAKTGMIQLTAKNLGKLQFPLAASDLDGKDTLKDAVLENIQDELEAVFTGITETIIDETYTEVSVAANGDVWSVCRQGAALAVMKNGQPAGQPYQLYPSREDGIRQAVRGLAVQMAKDSAGWAGKDLTVTLTREEAAVDGYPAAAYAKGYVLHFNPATGTDVDTLIDNMVASELHLFKEKNKGHEGTTGIEDVNYYPVSNVAVVDIYDAGKEIDAMAEKGEDAAGAKGLTMETLQRILNKVKEADVAVDNANMSAVKGDKAQIARFIDQVKLDSGNKDLCDIAGIVSGSDKDITGLGAQQVIDKIRDMFGADSVRTLGSLDDVKLTVRASGSLNGMAFTGEYHVIFRVTAAKDLAAVDEAMDVKIQAAADGIRTADKADAESPLGKAEYDPQTNEAVISVCTPDVKGEALMGRNLGAFVNTILNTAEKGQADKAEIVAAGKRTAMKNGETLTSDNIPELMGAFGLSGDPQLKELIGRIVSIDVYYGDGAVSYTVRFIAAPAKEPEPEGPAAEAAGEDTSADGEDAASGAPGEGGPSGTDEEDVSEKEDTAAGDDASADEAVPDEAGEEASGTAKDAAPGAADGDSQMPEDTSVTGTVPESIPAEEAA